MLFRRGNTQGKGLAIGKTKREKAAYSKVGLFNEVHAEQPHHFRGTFPQLPSEKQTNKQQKQILKNTKHKKKKTSKIYFKKFEKDSRK